MKINSITKIGLFVALVIVGTMISLPIGPVSVTLQTLILMISLLVLKPTEAVLVPIIYTILGLIGLPIFSNGGGGPSAIFTPSFGFIIGFTISTFITNRITANMPDGSRKLIIKLLLFNLFLYLIGLPYMYFILNNYLGKGVDLYFVLKFGLLLFIPGDTLKTILAFLVSKRLKSVDMFKN